MRTVRVFEPALCCNTGVCGPDVDESLVGFTADLAYARGLGADVERHNLANDPSAFAGNETVRAFLAVAGSAGLPLTLVDGMTVLTGRYPDRRELLTYAGVTADAVTADPVTSRVSVPVGATELAVVEESESCGGTGGCC